MTNSKQSMSMEGARYKARLRFMHVSVGGSPETFEAIWAEEKRREARSRSPLEDNSNHDQE